MDHAEMVEMAREIGRQKPFLNLAALFAPQRVRGFPKIRVGSACDGGYVMIDDFRDIDLALSFGVETNADWDLAVAERGVAVQQFDHSIETSPIAAEGVKFFRTKIAPSKGSESEASIASILSDANVTRDASVLLKIDIEADEWPVFDACVPADLARFSQILVEFHNFSHSRDPGWLGRATRIMRKMTSLFGVFHVHANNWTPMAVIGNVYFPEILEVSFANRARYQFDDTSELFPTALDQPNNPLRPDLYLGSFKYGQIGGE